MPGEAGGAFGRVFGGEYEHAPDLNGPIEKRRPGCHCRPECVGKRRLPNLRIRDRQPEHSVIGDEAIDAILDALLGDGSSFSRDVDGSNKIVCREAS
jgi:hypothetical protein